MTSLQYISPREASIFAAICDTIIAPAGVLPAVRDTDAAFSLDLNLKTSPPVNRIGVRASLFALELAPLLMGYGRRLRRLDAATRAAVLDRIDRNPVTAPMVEVVRVLSQMCYYGDLGVMRLIGYDPRLVVDRGAALRTKEMRW